MKWRPLGRVLACENWVQCPTPMVMDDRIRVYFSSRDGAGHSFMRFVDLDLNDPTKIIGAPSERVLENGAPGAFDACGQIPSFADACGGEVDLWYSGWMAPAGDAPYHNATGMVCSNDGGRSFERTYKCEGPILDRTPGEPYLAVTPCLVGDRLFYVTGKRWVSVLGRMEPIYVIAEAVWRNHRWDRLELPVIPQAYSHECFSRPYAMKIGGDLHLWYSYRSAVDYRDGSSAYCIGHAVERNGKFERLDDVEIERSDWDATMQCYPAVFEAKGRLFMLFNGGTFGKHGFGLAIHE